MSGKRKIRRIEDLLTPEDEAQLRADLARMAKQRRHAEAFAASFVMCAAVPDSVKETQQS